MSFKSYFVFIIILTCLKSNVKGQQGFIDQFTDSNFTMNPIWIGQEAKFKINSFHQLQLDDTGASSPAYLVTVSEVINKASWEFFVELDFPLPEVIFLAFIWHLIRKT